MNSNTVIVLLGDGVLVVDANSTPSAARSLIEQIKKLTPKPVKYVVNTHFHWDHTQGNEAYPNAWPAGVEIISSEATRANIEQLGIPRWKREIVAMPQEIEQLKSDLQKASSADQKESIQKKLVEAEAYFAELKNIQITLPTMTVDRRLILHRDSRTVEILWLGRAHTDGDLFVFLPAEKVLATGDALHGWTPTMRDSYPYEWISDPGCRRETGLRVRHRRSRRGYARQTKVRALETILSRPTREHDRGLRGRGNHGGSKEARIRVSHNKVRGQV